LRSFLPDLLVACGPGSSSLLNKWQALASCFIFAAIAIVAAVLTSGITKLVLRGPSELKHITVVQHSARRAVRGAAALSGCTPRAMATERIELRRHRPKPASYVTAFNLQPVPGPPATAPISPRARAIRARQRMHEAGPQRARTRACSTSLPHHAEEFQARWIGSRWNDTTRYGRLISPPAGGDRRTVVSSEIPLVPGTLSHNTGHDLRMVDFGRWHKPWCALDTVTVARDLVLYRPWAQGRARLADNEFSDSHQGGAKTINVSLTHARSAVRRITNPQHRSDLSRAELGV